MFKKFLSLVSALSFFVFPGNYAIIRDQVVKVYFYSSCDFASPVSYRIRPQVNVGLVSVRSSSSWISSNAPWSQLPALTSEADIILHSGQNHKVEIFFNVQNTLTGRVYKTNSFFLWYPRAPVQQ